MPNVNIDISHLDLKSIRRLLFTPCKDKKSLDKWIQIFLGIDLPDSTVDVNSNCSPLQMVWEIYSESIKAIIKDDEVNEDSRRYLYYSCRSGYKTLSESVIEILAALHLDRSTAHMAAVKDQSINAQRYVKEFLSMPYLRDFKEDDNKTETWVVRYVHKVTGDVICKAEFEELTPSDRNQYQEVKNFIKIIVATMAGTNSLHTNLLCVAGDTEILTKRENSIEYNQAKGHSNRFKKRQTARGIFRRLEGKNQGGRPGGEKQTVLSKEDGSIKTKIELFSINNNTGLWELAEIVRAQCSIQEAFKVTTDGGEFIECNKDHPLLTPERGYVMLEELSVGDDVVTTYKSKTDRTKTLNLYKVEEHNEYVHSDDTIDWWEQVLIGSLLGDCGIYKKVDGNPYIQEQHGLGQAAYLAWKRSYLSQKIRTRDLKCAKSGYTGEPLIGFSSGNSPILLPYLNIRKTCEGAEKLGPLGLAVWYMDDGNKGNGIAFSTHGFDYEQNQKLAKILLDNFGIKVDISIDEGIDKEDGKPYRYYYLTGGVEAKRRLVEICKPYIHPDMAYKFDIESHKSTCRYCNREYWFYETSNTSVICGSTYCRLLQNGTLKKQKIVSIESVGFIPVYDFTLDKNHNFVGNKFINKNCLDEIDVMANPAAYEQAKAIPNVREGKLPLTILTSTRKFSFGMVQEEINNAEKSGLKIRHWNLIDISTKCPPSRHLPKEPKITIYRSSVLMKAISEEEYNTLPENEQNKYEKDEGFAGCLSNCKIFSSCKSRLATHQKSTSSMLVPLSQVISNFKTFNIGMARAELLCEKPSSAGLIYPNLERETHMISAARMAYLLTGDKYPETFTKFDLIGLFRKVGAKFVAGMDFGFSHLFATVLGAVYGHRLYVFDTIAQPHLEPNQILDECKKLKQYNPAIYPDTENAQMISMLRKDGHRMIKWDKNAGSVLAGIETMRYKLKPAAAEPEMYFLVDDVGVDLLFRQLNMYHWVIDSAGRITEEPDEENDDLPDAIRYLVLNVFGKGKSKALVGKAPTVNTESPVYTKENWAQKVIQEQLGGVGNSNDPGRTGSKGKLKWSF